MVHLLAPHSSVCMYFYYEYSLDLYFLNTVKTSQQAE